MVQIQPHSQLNILVATNNFKALNPSGNFIGNYSVKEVIGIHTFTATTTVGISTVAEVRLI